jgi:hypothetical protein
MTLNRPVSGHISGLFNDWGMRLIPVDELTRYVAEGTGPLGQSHRPPGRRGRPRTVPARLSLEFVRSNSWRARPGAELAANRPRTQFRRHQTGQGGRQSWPSTVRAVLRRVLGLRIGFRREGRIGLICVPEAADPVLPSLAGPAPRRASERAVGGQCALTDGSRRPGPTGCRRR